MKIFQSISEFQSNKKTVVTLGTFDGVHLGHQKIIEKLTQHSDSGNLESVVLTFFPHPRMVLQEQSEIRLLNTIEERTDLLAKTGLDNLIIHPFDKAFSRLTAEEFVQEILVDQLNIGKIVIGHDHRFGRNRTADINDLTAFGEQYGFEVEQISAQEIDAVSISSTKIRAALEQGDISLANDYLGYRYFLTGTVVKGKQLGRTIGFPTANIAINANYKLVPKTGIYVVASVIDGKNVYGMMSIGTNPTVNDDNTLSIEVYYLDFEGDLYGKNLQVSFLAYIRDEQKFKDLDALKNQIEIDREWSNDFINKHLKS